MSDTIKISRGSASNFITSTADSNTIYMVTDDDGGYGSVWVGDTPMNDPRSHASSNDTYGVGNLSNYGHVKLSDETTYGESDVNSGIAATPKAVNTAYLKSKEYVDEKSIIYTTKEEYDTLVSSGAIDEDSYYSYDSEEGGETFSVSQTTGTSTTSVMSQNATTLAIANAQLGVGIELVQETGDSTTAVMSQNAVSEELDRITDYVDAKSIEIAPESVTPSSLSQSTIDLINTSGGGTVTNLADDEDLTTKTTFDDVSVIKFADKIYMPSNFSGKGRKYLRKNIITDLEDDNYGKNILTQSFFQDENGDDLENYIFNIQYDYDLCGELIKIPDGGTLNFDGGSFNNGTLNFNNCRIINDGDYNILINISPSGLLKNRQFTPTWLGAYGDGITDDTDFLAKSLLFSETTGTILCIENNYLITSSINYWDNEYHDIVLNIHGNLPSRCGEYDVSNYGGLSLALDTRLFQNSTIKGSINNVSICGERDEGVHFFSNCSCSGLTLEYCNISNFGAIFYDSSLTNTSHIINNKFLTAFWFARNVNTSSTITDSSIEFNYINGGNEPTTNSCFEWSYYNGSTISNNFIDFYRCIYHPKAISTQLCQGGISIGNQYQVFRYFYYPEQTNFSSHSFTSIGDCFNWVDPDSLEKLQTYETLTYSSYSQDIELPPYIALCSGTFILKMHDVIIQNNVGNYGLFLVNGLSSYSYSTCEYFTSPTAQTFINYNKDSGSNTAPFYNGGSYNLINSLKTNCYESVDELPTFSTGWCDVPSGTRVLYNNDIYISTIYTENSTKKAAWIKEQYNPNTILIGYTTSRPTTPDYGCQYYDTNISKPIWWNGSEWVDSLGFAAAKELYIGGYTTGRPTPTRVGFTYYDLNLSKLIVWDGSNWKNVDGTSLE